MKKIKIISLILLVITFTVLFTACGKVDIAVSDSASDNEITVQGSKNDTVEEILESVGISLDEKDEVSPERDSKLGDAAKIEIKRYAKVKITDGNKDYDVELCGGNVKQALEKAGIELGEKDVLDGCKESDKLTNGMEISIKRGKSIILIYGTEKEVKKTVSAKTVKQALKECGIEYGKDDIIEPSVDSKISDGDTITVKVVEYKTETKDITLYYKTEKRYSSSMKKGTSNVTTEGKNGKKQVEYKNKYVNGELTDSEVISEKVISNPVNNVVTYGTKEESTTQKPPQTTARKIISKEPVYDCDGSEHGYYIITYSDGSVEYQDF